MTWALAFLFGFAPGDPAVQTGPDAPHLDTDRAVQIAWNAAPGAARFRERWGPWYVRWDERTATPRAMLGPGTPVSDVAELIDDIARLGGVDPTDLGPIEVRRRGNRVGYRATQSWHGAPIEGALIDVFAQAGRIHLASAALYRPRLDHRPEPGEVVVPLHDEPLSYVLARKRVDGDDVVFVGRDGAELHRYTNRQALDVQVLERTIGDPVERQPARGVLVENDAGAEHTDDLGQHGLTGDISAALDGPYLSVTANGDEVAVDLVTNDLLVSGFDFSVASGMVLHHFHVVRDWLIRTEPDHPWPADNVPADVDITRRTCNAYYLQGTINFYVGEEDACENLGEIADVIYHEYGHGVHHKGLIGGQLAADVSEGASDYVSATITDDPLIAPEAWGPGTWIRDIAEDRVYPDDVIGQEHNDGLIFASFLWNLREQRIADLGWEAGVASVDQLLVAALAYGPRLTTVYEAVLAADDDDGDLTNGTPNACELTGLLDEHGIGPGPLGYVLLDHTPVADRPSEREPAAAAWTLTHVTEGCGAFDPATARLWYTVDPPRGAELDELVFTEVMPERDGTAYAAEIPAQPAGSEVAYYLSWASSNHALEDDTHGGERRRLHTYWVGDQQAVWCDDFEAGWGDWQADVGALDGTEVHDAWLSEWELAAPETESVWVPPEAWSPVAAMGTRLTEAGKYNPDNAQHLLSPELALDAGNRSLLLLQYRRWLTVEKGKFDQARIALTDPIDDLWNNPEEEPVLDWQWTQHALDLRHARDRRNAQVAWTLSTDEGLQFGGWALDDVCLVTLADAPGHYQIRDLVVEPFDDSTRLTWSQPFVKPLERVVLVRNDKRFPRGYADGEILQVDEEPVPGAQHTYVDTDRSVHDTWHYAVFASDEPDGGYYDQDVVEGENAGVFAGGKAKWTPAAEPAAEPACGCGPRAPASLVGVLLAGAAAVRRRRS